ncbi:MAG: DUF3267 domain-containing protein [Inhella sp.]
MKIHPFSHIVFASILQRLFAPSGSRWDMSSEVLNPTLIATDVSCFFVCLIASCILLPAVADFMLRLEALVKASKPPAREKRGAILGAILSELPIGASPGTSWRRVDYPGATAFFVGGSAVSIALVWPVAHLVLLASGSTMSSSLSLVIFATLVGLLAHEMTHLLAARALGVRASFVLHFSLGLFAVQIGGRVSKIGLLMMQLAPMLLITALCLIVVLVGDGEVRSFAAIVAIINSFASGLDIYAASIVARIADAKLFDFDGDDVIVELRNY